MKVYIKLLIFLCFSSSCGQGERKEQDINDFIISLNEIISERDYKRFLVHTDENIKYGGNLGRLKFLNKTKIDEKEASFWLLIDKVFKMPYKKIEDNRFVIPSFSFDHTNDDKYIVINNTFLFKGPNNKAKKMKSIPQYYTFRELNNEFNFNTYRGLGIYDYLAGCNDCWLNIEYDGVNGFVSTSAIYPIYDDSPIFFIEKKDNNWFISM